MLSAPTKWRYRLDAVPAVCMVRPRRNGTEAPRRGPHKALHTHHNTHMNPDHNTPGLVIGEPSTPALAEPVPSNGSGSSGATEPGATPAPGVPGLAERGSLAVTSVNRREVRKWLTGQGIPYSIAGNLPNGSLQAAYNDTSDAALNALKAQAGQTSGQGTDKGAEGTEGTEGEGATSPANGEPKSDAQKALETLAKSLGLPLGAVDEEAIRRIAREEAAKAKGKERRVTIVSPLGVKPLGERTLHPLFERVVKCISVDVNALVFGPAGSGKTTLATQVAEALGLPFHFNGAVLKKHELLGYTDANGNLVRTAFREAFEHGGLFLFDEVDASSAQALLTVNAAIANGKCDFPDGVIKAHKDFRCIAAANTNGNGATREYCGRNQLDGATLDRFCNFVCEYDDALTERIVRSFDLEPKVLEDAVEWCNRVVEYRKALGLVAVRGIISPRAAINGAKLLAAGFKFADLEETLVANKFGNLEERKRLLAKARELTAERHAKAAPAAPAAV